MNGMYPNGQVIVDATGVDMNVETAKTIDGLHAQLDGAFKSGKPIVLVGVVNDDVVYSPIASVVYPSSTSYVALLPGGSYVTVTNADSATVTNPV